MAILVNVATTSPTWPIVAALGGLALAAGMLAWGQTAKPRDATVDVEQHAEDIIRSAPRVAGSGEQGPVVRISQRARRRIVDSPPSVTTREPSTPPQRSGLTPVPEPVHPGEFIDREAALAAFDELVRPESPHRTLVYWGVAGQGKSRLLERLVERYAAGRTELIDLEPIGAGADGEYLDLALPVLEHLASAVRRWTGSSPTNFRRTIAAAERELRAVFQAVPQVRQHASGDISGSPVTVVLDPAGVRAAGVRTHQRQMLTDALLADLDGARLNGCVLLVDSVERLGYLDAVATGADQPADQRQTSWLLTVLLPRLLDSAPGLRVVLAGRERLVPAGGGSQAMELTEWLGEHTSEYLRSRDVPDPALHRAAHAACGGHPGWTGMVADAAAAGTAIGQPLTAEEVEEAARSEPVHHWLPEVFLTRVVPWMREVVTAAAIPRQLTYEAVAAVIEFGPLPSDWFIQLCRYSFVRPIRQPDGRRVHRLHPLVRSALLEWLDQHQPQRRQRMHTAARGYFAATDQRLEHAYHSFAIGDFSVAGEWHKMIDLFQASARPDVVSLLTEVVLAPENIARVLTGAPTLLVMAHVQAGYAAINLGRIDEAANNLRQARDIAERRDHREGQAAADAGLGVLARHQGDLPTATRCLERALTAYMELDDQPAVAQVHAELGVLADHRGDPRSAGQHFRAAMDIHSGLGNLAGVAEMHLWLGRAATDRDEKQRVEHLTAALRICAANGNQFGQAEVERELGVLALQVQDDPVGATGHFTAALAHYRHVVAPQGVGNALLGLGQAALERGDYASAREHLTAAVKLYEELSAPLGLGNAELLLGQLADVAGDPDDALAHLATALRRYSEIGHTLGIANAHHSTGIVLLARGRLAEAQEQLQRAAEGYDAAGMDEDARTARAKIAILPGLNEARAQGRAMEDRVPTPEDKREGLAAAELAYAVQALEERRIVDARRHARAALDLHTEHGNTVGQALAHRVLGHVARLQGEHDEAMTHLDRALTLSGEANHRADTAKAGTELGRLMLDRGDPVAASEYFHAAKRLFNSLGDEAGMSEVEALHRSAIEQERPAPSAERAVAWLKRGMDLLDQGEPGQAVVALRMAVAANHPQYSPIARYNLGIVLRQQGDTAGAEAMWRQTITSGHPEVAPAAANNLGIMLATQGSLDEAEEIYRLAIDSGHEYYAPAAANNLGPILMHNGDLAGAERVFHLAIDSGHPEHAPPAMLRLGIALARRNDYARAEGLFRVASESGHEDAGPHGALLFGALLEARGDTVGARAAYRKAKDSGHPEVTPKAVQALGSLPPG